MHSLFFLSVRSSEPRAQRAIEHTQVRLQPDSRTNMHRLAALSTRKCTLAAYRSTSRYMNAEGPSLANRSKPISTAKVRVSQERPLDVNGQGLCCMQAVG